MKHKNQLGGYDSIPEERAVAWTMVVAMEVERHGQIL